MLMGPGTLGVAAAQVNMFVNTTLATGEDGAVSWLQYAFRLLYLPLGIFGVSIATATLPDIARQAATDKFDEMRSTLSSALRMTLTLAVPSCLGLMVLASPIVELIYERGRFEASDTANAAAALVFYAPGLIGDSLVKIASPSFYAMGDARTPVLVSLFSIVTNLGLNLWLVHLMGFRGLALGTSLAATINGGLLLWLLSKRVDGLEARRVTTTFVKVIVASGVMAVAAWAADSALRDALPPAELASALMALAIRTGRVVGAITAGLAALALTAHVLQLEEFRQVSRRVMARLSR
jgi:putative peptidoglycan lipid II flippase